MLLYDKQTFIIQTWRVLEMPKRVLIVDDAAFMRMMIRDILEKNGFEVAGEASNGLEAVKEFQELRPDVTTMDIIMPEMNGIDAVKAIKQIDPDAKIIMLSAMGQQAMVMEAIQAGAQDFVVKPFQGDRVIDALNRVLAT
jgi:two-component system chemotaxis response regulator CheY